MHFILAIFYYICSTSSKKLHHMKKILFLLLLPIICTAQPHIITTVAGSGVIGFSGDGGPATSASLGAVMGVYKSSAGDIYIQDDGNNRIRKVNSLGIITTFAGGGTSTADGIPATAASIGFHGNGVITEDPTGNILFVDNHRIRKVDLSTGIISTIAGGLTWGFSGDGGPATAALLNSPVGLAYDASGNLYVGDEDNYRIRKISTSGIISTFAGTGIPGFSGDGGPASAAQFQSPDGLCFDATGNLYVADRYNQRIRKISTSGVISTIAGGSTSGFSGDGGPATAARFNEPSSLNVDSHGNLYIGDFHNERVRKINLSGTISTVAGGGGSTTDGVPATSAELSDVWAICVDNDNNIYIADRYLGKIKKVALPGILVATSDSFSVYLTNDCLGPRILNTIENTSVGRSVVTNFGDGHIQSNSISGTSDYLSLTHNYITPGLYSIKQVLYIAGSAVDSVTFSYNHVLCNVMKVEYFNDENNNCNKELSEHLLSTAVNFRVDSNGVAIDTIPSLGSIYYYAKGNAGDVYRFTEIGLPGGFSYTCLSTGSITDTMLSVTTVKPAKRIGVICAVSDYNLYISSTARTGSHAHRGNVFAGNLLCQPTTGTVRLNFNPVYIVSAAFPAPTSSTSSSLTWDLSAMSCYDSWARSIEYHLERSDLMMPGDTVHSNLKITPISGDIDTSNNIVIRIDTSRSSYDPNMIEVNPNGCLPSGATPVKLQYTIHFENMGNDTAHNIYVMDTLADYLDPSTLKMKMSSHPMYVLKTTDFTGRTVLKFDFPNIKLLDSSYRGLCNGMLAYTIYTKPGLTTGTIIKARAGIYFDDNPVVLTNETETKIGCPTVVQVNNIAANKDILIYPNPTKELLFVSAASKSINRVEISNSIGQVIQQTNVTSNEIQLNVANISAGLYYVIIYTNDGKVTKKFIKL